MDEWMMSSQLRGRKIAFEWMSLSRLCVFILFCFILLLAYCHVFPLTVITLLMLLRSGQRLFYSILLPFYYSDLSSIICGSRFHTLF